jgi:glycosyltransferase involved in cell wall biosynthesis
MALREEWGVSPFDILAVAIGRLEQIKAPDQVLKAFLRSAPENPRLRLVIAGEGPMVPVLKEMLAGAPELAERVRLPGRLPGEQLPGLLQAADVFLNPDMGAPAFGLANAEALCMGAPVITTAVGAHREVVRGEEDGLLMEPYHTVRNALTRLLPHLPESEESRQSRADRARRRFRRGRMITRLESVYRTLLES